MSGIHRQITTAYVLRKNISKEDILSMFTIFLKYYQDIDIDTFINDLDKKDGALITRRKDNSIVGFSTVVRKAFYYKNDGKRKKAYAIFSGDTIMEKAYWGSTSLHFAAARYGIVRKLISLRTPIYWFLISKGYKTYLTMANNFLEYWPRYDRENDPEGENIIKTLCQTFFPNYYDEGSGLLYQGNNCQKLKRGVTEITDGMKNKYPKIAFFEKKNPTWWKGTELPCAVKLTYCNIIYGSLRQVVKFVKQRIQPTTQVHEYTTRQP